MDFLDSHAHLLDPAFEQDRADIIRRMQEAGVARWVEIGCQVDEWEPALNLSTQYPQHTVCALGIHPEFAHTYTPNEQARLTELLKDSRVVAVGEIGLDYFYLEECPEDIQLHTLHQMIALANSVQKPIVLHVRRQEEDYTPYIKTFEILKHEWMPLPRPHSGILHCFSAGYEQASQALDHGLLLGINGCFTYKKNEYIRQAVKKVGARHLVLETDCPYLSPQGKRGTRNDPSNIPLIAQWVADYLDMPVEKLAEITTQNALEVYGWK